MKITEIHFETIDSTNAFAKREYHSFDKFGLTLIWAKEQTRGQGRRQRAWTSPKDVNLYATFCFTLPLPTRDLACLSMIGAYSLATLLEESGLIPSIKWPNDVQISGKKIAGVLSETIFEKDFVQMILGIGLNINMEKEVLENIDQPATSLKIETGHLWDISMLLKKLTTRFLSDLENFRKLGFAPFRQPIETLLSQKGKRILCHDGHQEWEGICQGIAEDGKLLLLLPTGKVLRFFSADVRSAPSS